MTAGALAPHAASEIGANAATYRLARARFYKPTREGAKQGNENKGHSRRKVGPHFVGGQDWGRITSSHKPESPVHRGMTVSNTAHAASDPEKLSEIPAEMPLPPMGESASGQAWRLREADSRQALAIAQRTSIDLIAARVLAARGVTAETADTYLNPSLRASMPDPIVLKDMDVAAKRLSEALMNGETVAVFGDYDVDGTTAAAILKSYFDAIGAPMLVYLPDRIAEGYGPSIDAFLSLQGEGAEVIVTVDCGASAHEPVEQAAAAGLDIIVLDHHQMHGPPPSGAVATVNPNRPDDLSGLHNLSAAGVAFMTLVALNRRLRENGFFSQRQEPDLRAFLDLAALGLVCDVMEMTGLTRVLVAQGLKVLASGGNRGLQALGRAAGVKGRPSPYHLGFLLGPRINAAGRIGHARLAFELLTTDDQARREFLAEKLHIMNAERQEIEATVQAEAVREIETTGLAEDDVIVVAGEDWHPGVIGIVAGRLKEHYDRPAIVIGVDGETGKGSGRSITGVDLGAAIADAKERGLLVAGGGHAMAAGLTIDKDNVKRFRDALNTNLASAVRLARAGRTRHIDGVIAASAVTKPFAGMIDRAGPFGPGNPEPLFVLTNMRAEFVKVVGKGHLALTLVSTTGDKVRAIAFRAEGESLGALLKSDAKINVAGKVRADEWRGGEAGQLQITDAASAL